MSMSGGRAGVPDSLLGVVGCDARAVLARAEHDRDLYEERAREVWRLRGERAAYLRIQGDPALARGRVAAGVGLRRRVLRGLAVVVFPVSITVSHALDVFVFVVCLAVWEAVTIYLERRSAPASIARTSSDHGGLYGGSYPSDPDRPVDRDWLVSRGFRRSG
jgi:hypothetical protein